MSTHDSVRNPGVHSGSIKIHTQPGEREEIAYGCKAEKARSQAETLTSAAAEA